MIDSKTLLTSLLKTTQMGQVGIRSVLDLAIDTDLRQALATQLREYDAIETEAHTLAGQRGWDLREVDPATRFLADRITRARLTGNATDTRIAGMMIRGNTRGMIKGLTNARQYTGTDRSIRILARKLLDCESANILQMQQFL